MPFMGDCPPLANAGVYEKRANLRRSFTVDIMKALSGLNIYASPVLYIHVGHFVGDLALILRIHQIRFLRKCLGR